MEKTQHNKAEGGATQLVGLESLTTPALIVDRCVVEANAQSMIEAAKRLGVGLRPHVKTHKVRDSWT